MLTGGASRESIALEAATHPADYRQVALSPRTYGDSDAAELEYTYTADGASLHGANLLLRAGGNVYVLCWVGAEYMWAPQLDLKSSFQVSFALDT